jgi:N-acyl-D-amino-acid deacylase
MALDLLIRNGTVVDGSGGARFTADVGIQGGRIVDIGRIRSNAATTINADGLIVAPGFIDGHTHMDAQVAWDPLGSCSCWHGVTSVFMGNCGFALAPCKEEDREWFARCLEAVEDIPTEAMMSGIDWNWESFPEYLAQVESLPKGINYGAYLGHSALRMYAMGERGLHETAKEADLRVMGDLLKDAMQAGAVGFSTSRATTHNTPDGSPVASRIADWSELEYLVGQLAELNAGIIQVGPDVGNGAAHLACLEQLRGLAIRSGRPVMFGTFSTRQGEDPYPWQRQLQFIDEAAAAGGRMYGQATTRSINALFSFKSYLPFDQLPAWREFRDMPMDEQVARLRDKGLRARLIADEENMRPRDGVFQGGGAATTDPRKPDYDNLFALLDVRWDDPSIGQLSREQSKHPVEVMMDLSLDNGMDQIFVQPLVNESPDDVLGMLRHPRTLATFSDSGAHVCQEMGASLQTHLLSYWVRERQMFTLEEAVRMLTFDNASAWELGDRGLIRKGLAADVVIFDEAGVQPRLPTVESDLPGGARRLVQKADGIEYTIVNGEIALAQGESTGRYAGQVLKGAGAQ